jgi:hypothetical protein
VLQSVWTLNAPQFPMLLVQLLEQLALTCPRKFQEGDGSSSAPEVMEKAAVTCSCVLAKLINTCWLWLLGCLMQVLGQHQDTLSELNTSVSSTVYIAALLILHSQTRLPNSKLLGQLLGMQAGCLMGPGIKECLTSNCATSATCNKEWPCLVLFLPNTHE